MKKYTFLILVFSLLTSSCFSQGDVEIKPIKLSENVYALYGSGGNMGLCIGDDGTFLIDDQFDALSDKIKAAIAKLSDNPVNYLVNTHYHGDHTGGNVKFAEAGAIIIAHDNVRERLSKDQFIQARNRSIKASPEAAWPVITFTSDIKLHLNGESIMIMHVHNAHTDGDSFVFFPESNVLHMGDIFFNGLYPYIDIDSGGTISGYLAAIDAAIMLVDDKTQIIPGHGEIANKSDLLDYKSMLTVVSDRIIAAVKEGKTLEQTISAGPTKEYDAEWEWSFINSQKLVTAIYTDLTREGKE
jgi:glyoxylase-like metal-dependent hydrolase (beta-lactamase superfamily II)